MQRFFRWAALLDADGRRAWAFLALLGASGVFTTFVAVVLWMVRAKLEYVFYLGIAAHIQLFACLSGFLALFIRRDVKIDTKLGSVSFNDKGTDDASARSTTRVESTSVEVDRSGGSGS